MSDRVPSSAMRILTGHGHICLIAPNVDLSQILDHVGEGLRTAMSGNDHQGPWIVRKLIGPILFKRICRQRRMKAGIKVP